jgi:DNA topoisomerase VI subunit B
LVASYEAFHNAIANAVDEFKFYNKKQTEKVVAGLIATATTHVGYLEYGKGGGGSNPNDPKDHWRKEIKAALERAKRLIEKRLTGDRQTELLKQVKDLADKANVGLE